MSPHNSGAGKQSGYIPTLDGWRAVAILSVMLFHDPVVHRFGFVTTRQIHTFGWAGVDLFFAISGILICSRLLAEEKQHGSISIRGFYIRRLFRIQPAAWAFIVAYIVLSWAGQLPWSTLGWLLAVLMVRNYFTPSRSQPNPAVHTDHFWSLAVEEHFYLLLPALLVYVRRRRLLLLASLGLVGCLWSLFALRVFHVRDEGNMWRTDLRLHQLLFPAALAVALGKPSVRAWFVRWCKPLVALGCFAGLAAAVHFTGPDYGIRTIVIPLCFPLIVVSTILHPESVPGRILELAPVRHVGRLSYSLYLWQQIFLIPEGAAGPITTLQVFPLNYLAPFVCATASYYFIEKTFIGVGHRLAPPVDSRRSEPTQRGLSPESVPVRDTTALGLASEGH